MVKVITGIIGTVLVGLGIFWFFNSSSPLPSSNEDRVIKIATEQISNTQKEISATFEIYTEGTKRVFTDSKYHNRSQDIFITAKDPSLIQIKKPDITWQQFFDTLPPPMKVTKECLTTGTDQSFCTNEKKRLTFILNGVNTTHTLDLPIKNSDTLIIRYK